MHRDLFPVLGILGAALVLVVIIVLNKVNSSEYIYVARGVQCKEYDKESNTLKGCDDSMFGEVEIINPISILKVRIK